MILTSQDSGNRTQTSTLAVSEAAQRQRTPRWGLKRADGRTQVSTNGDIADPLGNGCRHL